MKHTLEAFHSNPRGAAISLRGGRPAWSTAVGLGPIPYRFAGSNPAPRISFSHAGENHVHAVNKGENPAPRISFSHAGENHVHAVNKGENPAPRISFSHAGENHVHAVNKGENPAPRISFKQFSQHDLEPIQTGSQGSEPMLSRLKSMNIQRKQARLGRPFESLNRDLPTRSSAE